MVSTRDADLTPVRDAAARVAAGYGLDVFDLHFRRETSGWVLRVVLDRPANPAADSSGSEEPVGIVDCQRVSQDLGAILDVDEDCARVLDRPYTLEVSSPGLDRPLRGASDYRRFVGRLAKIVTREPIGGQSAFAGRLAGIENGVVRLTEGHRTHRVPLDLISRARLEVEF